MSRCAAEDAEKRTGIMSTGLVAEAKGLNVLFRGKQNAEQKGKIEGD